MGGQWEVSMWDAAKFLRKQITLHDPIWPRDTLAAG